MTKVITLMKTVTKIVARTITQNNNEDNVN